MEHPQSADIRPEGGAPTKTAVPLGIIHFLWQERQQHLRPGQRHQRDAPMRAGHRTARTALQMFALPSCLFSL